MKLKFFFDAHSNLLEYGYTGYIDEFISRKECFYLLTLNNDKGNGDGLSAKQKAIFLFRRQDAQDKMHYIRNRAFQFIAIIATYYKMIDIFLLNYLSIL